MPWRGSWYDDDPDRRRAVAGQRVRGEFAVEADPDPALLDDHRCGRRGVLRARRRAATAGRPDRGWRPGRSERSAGGCTAAGAKGRNGPYFEHVGADAVAGGDVELAADRVDRDPDGSPKTGPSKR